ncbi:MAG: HesA/MoeB/ThiF family protein [Candidatus Hinthialibacter antarcticus]|nr:HesA/MoeB/ThiF family protein [Candidatus Hinthialibacter antarcticus]
MNQKSLTDIDHAVYEWQMWVDGFGEPGQRALKNATVLISRAGGLGSVVAYELAAAGVGKLVLAHKGNVKPSDLNRQLLMTYDWLGKPRVESAKRRLNELNPHIEIEAIEENISEDNAERIISQVDLIVDCAPLFEERFAMNKQAVQQNKPLVECAMFDLDAQITSIQPGKTPCLQCLHPEKPDQWKREFPVFGAVSGTVGCLGAMEAIKIIADFGEPLYNKLLTMDLRTMRFRRIEISRNPVCPVCS